MWCFKCSDEKQREIERQMLLPQYRKYCAYYGTDNNSQSIYSCSLVINIGLLFRAVVIRFWISTQIQNKWKYEEYMIKYKILTFL